MIYLDGKLLNKTLAANRVQLISQNMVEKGHTQEEAAREIDLLFKIVEMVKSLEVALTVGNQAGLEIKLESGTKLDSLTRPEESHESLVDRLSIL